MPGSLLESRWNGGGLAAVVELEGWHTDITVLELIHTNYISKLQPAASP
jgi:hypothetical protein